MKLSQASCELYPAGNVMFNNGRVRIIYNLLVHHAFACWYKTVFSATQSCFGSGKRAIETETFETT